MSIDRTGIITCFIVKFFKARKHNLLVFSKTGRATLRSAIGREDSSRGLIGIVKTIDAIPPTSLTRKGISLSIHLILMRTRMLRSNNLPLSLASSPLYAWVNAISRFLLYGMEKQL